LMEVHWLASVSLPLFIQRGDQSQGMVTRLIKTWAVDAGPVAPTQAEAVKAYRRIDFADFGDMEKDPLVRKVVSHIGGQIQVHVH
jgi:hypothetical protein